MKKQKTKGRVGKDHASEARCLFRSSSAWASWPSKAGIVINWTVDGDSKATEQRIKVLFQGLPGMNRNSCCLFKGIFPSNSLCPRLPPSLGPPHSCYVFQECVFASLPSSCPRQRRASVTLNWILGLSVRNGGVPGKMLTAVTQPSLCHQAAAVINERIKRSTQGAKKVDNDLCLPEGKII